MSAISELADRVKTRIERSQDRLQYQLGDAGISEILLLVELAKTLDLVVNPRNVRDGISTEVPIDAALAMVRDRSPG